MKILQLCPQLQNSLTLTVTLALQNDMYKDQQSPVADEPARHTASIGERANKVDAQCDKLATEVS